MRDISLKEFMDLYNITSEAVAEELRKNETEKEFYDKYINWGSASDFSDSYLSPKALDRLTAVFNKAENFMNPPETNSNKKGNDTNTSVETQANKTDEGEARIKHEEIRQDQLEKTNSKRKPRTKKSKFSISKTYLNEISSDNVIDTKVIRKFLMGDGVHKIEDIAIMTDSEVNDIFTKEYVLFNTEKGIMVFKKKALEGIINDVYLIKD